MATSFTQHPPGTDPALVVTDAMIAIDHELAHLPAKLALQLIEFCRNRLAASEARVLADRYENGATDRAVEDLARGDGKTSKKEAKKRASRAKATNANPDIANKLETGQLSAEQADVIAEAAADTDGAAACDASLIDDVAATTPEQGRKKAKKFVNDRRSADDIQTKHDKQRCQRGWYRHRLANGNAAITFHGDDHSIDQIEQSVHEQSNAEYQADGGRDVAKHKHPRTSDQRGFDAGHTLITRPAPSTSNTASCPAGPGTSAATKARSPRNVVHVNATPAQLTGDDTTPIVTADGKPLPRSVFDELMCEADIIGHIFSGNGELLWQSRKKRLATPAQVNGLIARDGGCVLCQAHHSKCVAHHLLPWEAPGKGETNIDNLAFLCGDCHTRVHQRKLTLFYDPVSQSWKTRAAWDNEIPLDGHHNSHKRNGKPKPDKYRTPAEQGKPRADQQRNNKRRALF